jgi:hypothetical protein
VALFRLLLRIEDRRLTTVLANLDDFSGPNARRARLDRPWRTLDESMNLPQVGIPAALGHVVRVTDVISILGTFSTKVADSSHCRTSSESNSRLPQSLILTDNRNFAHRECAAGGTMMSCKIPSALIHY